MIKYKCYECDGNFETTKPRQKICDNCTSELVKKGHYGPTDPAKYFAWQRELGKITREHAEATGVCSKEKPKWNDLFPGIEK